MVSEEEPALVSCCLLLPIYGALSAQYHTSPREQALRDTEGGGELSTRAISLHWQHFLSFFFSFSCIIVGELVLKRGVSAQMLGQMEQELNPRSFQ